MLPVIALTGGVGSGKTAVAAIFEELGAAVIDTDVIAHELTAPAQPGTQAIAREFGTDYLTAEGALDRARMRTLVFSDPAAKTRLESILHPMIRAEVSKRLDATAREARARYVVIVVPLLIESGAYRDLAQRILVVDCDEHTQVERVMRRSGLDETAVRAIMRNQVSRAERLHHADDIVNNGADLATLRENVTALHRQYVELGRQIQGPTKPRI